MKYSYKLSHIHVTGLFSLTFQFLWINSLSGWCHVNNLLFTIIYFTSNYQSRSENVIYYYQYLTQVDVYRRLLKMRLGTTVHHSNPRSRTLVGWKNSMPIEQYRHVRDHKRNQKNIPTSSSDYKEQHLIIAHRLAELEKRRVGTRYLPKGQKAEDKKVDDDRKCIIS